MLRNNADVRRCSYFELGLPVVVYETLKKHQVPFAHLFIDKFKTYRLQENWEAKLSTVASKTIVARTMFTNSGYSYGQLIVCLRALYYTLNVRSRGKQLVLFSQESWCFPRRSRGKHQDSRENKTNWFPEGPDIKYFVIFPDFHFNVLQQQQKNTLNRSESKQYDSVLIRTQI